MGDKGIYFIRGIREIRGFSRTAAAPAAAHGQPGRMEFFRRKRTQRAQKEELNDSNQSTAVFPGAVFYEFSLFFAAKLLRHRFSLNSWKFVKFASKRPCFYVCTCSTTGYD
jgi:hypothetical protein